MPTPAETSAAFARMWDRVQIDPNRRADALTLARRIIANKPQYAPVQAATGVPWPVIGVIHNRESGLSFKGHLHNGDSLSGYTRRVPSGRPRLGHGPPFTWTESAIDALTMPPHQLNKIGRWTVERILHECEKYNGWGYRGKGNSPYLWSWTSEYRGGKYVRDHVYDPNVRDAQAGCVAILKALAEIDAEAAQCLCDRDAGGAATPVPLPVPQPGPAASAAIAFGEISDRVTRLQLALQQRNYPVGEIDGEFGPLTRDAVAAFQRDHRLTETGIADAPTLQTLGLAPGAPQVGGGVARPDEVLRLLLAALLARSGAGPAPEPAAPAGSPVQALQALIAALGGRVAATAGASADAGAAKTPPVILSPIDQLLGGQMLAGKKTLLAVIAYVILAILQATGQVGTATGAPAPTVAVSAAPTTGATLTGPGAAAPGTSATGATTTGTPPGAEGSPPASTASGAPRSPQAPAQAPSPQAAPAEATSAPVVTATPAPGTKTPTGQILTTLIAAFGGLGLLAKFDRLIRAVAIISGKLA
ncbi:MAG: peptidoglycan-binding protein [Xanthobacteraceae bacterium]